MILFIVDCSRVKCIGIIQGKQTYYPEMRKHAKSDGVCPFSPLSCQNHKGKVNSEQKIINIADIGALRKLL